MFCTTCTGGGHKPGGAGSTAPSTADHTVIPFSIAIKRMSEILIYKANECTAKVNFSLLLYDYWSFSLSFIYSFIIPFIHSFCLLFFHSSCHSFIHLFNYLFIHPYIHSSLHIFIIRFFDLYGHLCIHLLIYSFIQSFLSNLLLFWNLRKVWGLTELKFFLILGFLKSNLFFNILFIYFKLAEYSFIKWNKTEFRFLSFKIIHHLFFGFINYLEFLSF